MSDQTLTAIFEIPASRSGCYILRKKGRVVYVGMSGDVLSRLAGHKAKTFDSVQVIWCKRRKAATMERALIAQLIPELNNRLVPGRVCPVKFWTNYSGPIPQVEGCLCRFDDKASGRAMKKYRSLCGVSIKALSEASDIQPATIQRIEDGGPCNSKTWNQLCKGFFEISKALTRRGQTRTKTLGI